MWRGLAGDGGPFVFLWYWGRAGGPSVAGGGLVLRGLVQRVTMIGAPAPPRPRVQREAAGRGEGTGEMCHRISEESNAGRESARRCEGIFSW